MPMYYNTAGCDVVSATGSDRLAVAYGLFPWAATQIDQSHADH